MIFHGSCHCGAVTFEVEAPEDVEMVPRANFSLRSGERELTTYRFNTGVAQHRFCRICGVKPFDTPPPRRRVVPFDGRNWEANAGRLVHKSRRDGE